MENMNKLNKPIFQNKNIDFHEIAGLHSWNPGFKTGFHNLIPCLKLWAQRTEAHNLRQGTVTKTSFKTRVYEWG